MDAFCGTTLWDPQISWNTTSPELSPCFEDTVLLWIPCVFLWLGACYEAYRIKHSQRPPIPWTSVILLKILLPVALSILSATELAAALVKYSKDNGPVYPVEYYSPLIKCATLCLATTIVFCHRKRGLQTSGVIFLFWILLSIGSIISYISLFGPNSAIEAEGKHHHMEWIRYIARLVFTPLVVVELVIFCFSGKDKSFPTPGKDVKNQYRESPEESGSFLSFLTFTWFDGLVLKGFRSPLQQEDMWPLKKANRTGTVFDRFSRYWSPSLSFSVPRKGSSKQSVLVSAKILGPILKTFWPQLLFAAGLNLVSSLLNFVPPIVLDWLITYMKGEEVYWHGFFYTVILFASSFTMSMFSNQYDCMIATIAMRMRSAVIAVVYRKSLRMSNTGKKDFTTGQIVNLMAVDTQRIVDYVLIANYFWAGPLQIGIALYLLWAQLGVATLAGMGIMVLLIPFNGIITTFWRKSQIVLMKEKDKRTKLMNEILNGIKVLKLYSWEKSFTDQVLGIRDKELAALKTQAWFASIVMFSFSVAPTLVGYCLCLLPILCNALVIIPQVALFSFMTFTLIDENNILDASKAFVSLSLFNLVKLPLAYLPMLVTNGAMFYVSMNRINKFLGCDEIDPNSVNRDADPDHALIIEKGSFSWTKKDPEATIKNVSFSIKRNKLVAVVGTVGAGKSSLLSALLGDMHKMAGYANISGSVAYVPQQAWIQNATVRQNILFTSKYRKKKYDTVIEGCALESDFTILTGGDSTEIGEKGINLSGGQKQRISLARAVYSEAEIYLLDDPLSAVDSHVGKHIFDKVIGPKGLLKGKTRVLVTHKVSLLPHIDEIIVMKNGFISEQGSYSELLARKGAFAEFLVHYLSQDAEDEDGDELEVIGEMAASVRPELERHLSMISKDSGSSEPTRFNADGSFIRRRTSSTGSRDSLKKETIIKPILKNIEGGKLTETEASESGSVKWSVYMDYFKAVGSLACFMTMMSYTLSHALNIGSSLWLSEWSNDSLDPLKMNQTELRTTRLEGYAGLGLGEGFFLLITNVAIFLGSLRASRVLHNRMLENIMKAPMSFFDTTPLGRILNRFSKDMDTADVVIRMSFKMFLTNCYRVLVTFIIISMQTPIFLAGLVPVAIVYYFVQKFYVAASRQLRRLESTSRSPIYNHFSETITGTASIKAYGANQVFIEECDRRVDLNHSSYLPSVIAARWLAVRLEFLGNIIVFMAAIFAVLSKDSLSPSVAGLSISYALTITMNLNMLVRGSADVENNLVSVERCVEYMKTETEASWYIDSKRPDPEWPDAGHIEFEHYSTRYREGLDLVLKGVSCELKAGEKVGIVGRTGAGKSSLTLALFRLIEPAGGRILIDGVDVFELGLHDLRSRLTIIPQDPVLFTGSLRMNLDPFDMYSDQQVWRSLELSHLKGFVSDLETGLLHPVTEGGDNLSVGQRQLICLARALLRKTKVLVLDEATAGVDLETDDLIQATIRTQFADCTIVTIAHRLNTILDYDRIMVMDKGQVADFEDPKVMLRNPHSIFYSMCKDAGLV